MSSFVSSHATAMSFTAGKDAPAHIGVGRPGSGAGPEGPAGPPLSRFALGMILATYMYMDASVSLWNQLYKESRLVEEAPGCEPLRRLFCEDHFGRGVSDEWLEVNPECYEFRASTETAMVNSSSGDLNSSLNSSSGDLNSSSGDTRRLDDLNSSSGDAGTAAPVEPVPAQPSAQEVPTEDTTVDDVNLDQEERHELRACSWFITRRSGGHFRRRPQTYTKGAALCIQAICGLLVFYAYNFWAGGMEQLKMCFDTKGLLKFGMVGTAFGLSAVFGFLAQDALPPGSYALYSQSGIIVIPILWRIVFNTPLNNLTWVHIVLIAVGIFMYRASELGAGDNTYDTVGLWWISMKICTTSMATVFAELFLKGGSDVPFTVQVAYILPWKILTTFATIFILPPHHLPDRDGGMVHDWNFLTVIIITTNLGDTIGSAVVAKLFDSVVKAVCGVFSIIMPTWVVSYIAGWETIEWSTAGGQLKVSGGIIVVMASFAYVLGRNLTSQLQLQQSAQVKLLTSEDADGIEMTDSCRDLMKASKESRDETEVV